MTFKVLQYPDPSLYTPTKRIKQFNKGIKDLAWEMMKIVKQKEAVGIAANQIGVPLSLIIVCDPDNEKVYAMCNPKIMFARGTQTGNEGCLSSEGYLIVKERPYQVKVRYYTTEGVQKTVDLKGLAARCVAHEVGHLHGVDPLIEDVIDYPWDKDNRKLLASIDTKSLAGEKM